MKIVIARLLGAVLVLICVAMLPLPPALGTSLLKHCRMVRVDGNYFVIVFSGAIPEEKLRPKPSPVAGLQVWRNGQNPDLIWSIEAESLSFVDVVEYGVVPAGYRQDYPRDGSPEPLVNGSYELRCGGPGYFEIESDGVKNLDRE